jgi:transcriptional regulator with XRE-family HTH domain
MEAMTTTAAPRWAPQGARLKAARKRHLRVGVHKAAKLYGTTPRHLIRLENGEHRPGSELLLAIARETGETIDHFGYPSDDEDEEDALRLALRNALPTPQADALYQELMLRLPTARVAS